MKDLIVKLNKVFENRHRLGIMSVLIVNDWVDFNFLKTTIDITDGNLASHMNTLEKNNYVKVRKGFIGRKPNTSYTITPEGKRAFKEHLDIMEIIIRSNTKK